MALAQERDRVFLRFVGDNARKVEGLALLFEGAVLSEGVVEFAGTTEMDGIYAECRTQMGVSASEERSCRLQAARRLFVSELLELSANKTDDGRVRLGLAVWNTNDNTKVFGVMVTVDASKLDQGIEDGLPELASRYLCYRGVTRHCDKAVVVDSDGPVEVREDAPNDAVRIQPGETPPLIGESAMSAEARQVTFLPHESEGHWTLRAADNRTVCALPCTRWVAPRSGAAVVGLDDRGDTLSRIEVPNELGWGPDRALQASIDLDSDWQTWEIASAVMGGGGFVVTMVGMGLTLGGLGDSGTSATETVGWVLFGLGAVSFSMVTPVYAFYNWVKDDGRDNLIFQETSEATPVSSSRGISMTWTF